MTAVTADDGDVPPTRAQGAGQRFTLASFWTRLFAVLLDVVVAASLVSLLAVATYQLSGGAIRMSGIAWTACRSAGLPRNFDPATPPPGVSPAAFRTTMGDPANFHPNRSSRCRSSFLGMEMARYYKIAEVTPTGPTSWRTLTYTAAVDRSDTVTRPRIVGDATGLALLLLTAAGEALFGASIGKRLMGLRVVSAEAPEARLPPGRAIARNLLLFGICGVTALLGPGMPLGALGAAFAPLGFTPFVWFPVLLVAGWFGEPTPFWDRWTGVRVVRRAYAGRPPRDYPLPSRWD